MNRLASRRILLCALPILLLVACGGTTESSSARRPTTVPTTVVTPTPATTCHANGPYPDPRCTPGALNPDVTQETIRTTICVTGWTSTVRPSLAVTTPIKTERMKAYGIPESRRTFVELDHWLPLELGGATEDVRNLWPEDSVPVPGYHEKDLVENFLRGEVCKGDMTLAAAQMAIETNWVRVWKQLPATPTPKGTATP